MCARNAFIASACGAELYKDALSNQVEGVSRSHAGMDAPARNNR